MSVYTSRPSVGTTAALLGPNQPESPQTHSASMVIYNPGPTAVVVGNAAVTASTGLSLPSGATLQADLGFGDSLYGVVASGTQTVHVLESGE